MRADRVFRSAAHLSILLVACFPFQANAAEIVKSEITELERGPDIVLIESKERTVYEYRHNGVLRTVKIVPSFGKPYYLVPADPTRAKGDLERAETLVAQWHLIEF